VFPAVEQYGLIWTTQHASETGEAGPATVDVLETGTAFPLRALPFAAPPVLVMQHLADYTFSPTATLALDGSADIPLDHTAESKGSYSVKVTATSGPAADTVMLFVQPVDSNASVVYAVLADTPSDDEYIGVLHHHAQQLDQLRSQVEALAAELPTPAPMVVALERIEPNVDGPPAQRARGDAEVRVTVKRKWDTAVGVAAFELAPLDNEPLPTVQPGSHIDVHLPNGMVRQYSLVNAAGDQERYVIGVKREPESRGGSSCLHDTVQEGDVLAISAPRNNFALRRDAVATTLIAGGIGITPLLSMAETLVNDGLPVTLHYFVQSVEHAAFGERLDRLGEAVVRHNGLNPTRTGAELDTILAGQNSGYEGAHHVYICGPGPMLDAARSAAANAGWPDAAVHFEYFKNTTEIDQSTSFEISLARSSLTLEVNAGETILDVLRSNGIVMPSSCEQGACGTCVVGVIDGDPIHQDVYLNTSEREAADRIVTCVSRSASANLVLDI
jgi:ferredoxin-NADP reductase